MVFLMTRSTSLVSTPMPNPGRLTATDEEEPEIQEEVVEAEAVELSPEEPKAEDPA